MRKALCWLSVLAVATAFSGAAVAATKKLAVPTKKYTLKAPKGSNPAGKYSFTKVGSEAGSKFAGLKAQNHLSYAVNQKLLSAGRAAKKGSYVNGTIDTVPYFSSWYITGSRNSVYPYAMVGHSPSAGGSTWIQTRLMPLTITLLDVNGNPLYTFDPTVATDPEGSDVDLVAQSPLYDSTTTYPGPPAQTGQFEDGHQRVSFRTTAAANWHTLLNTPEWFVSYGVGLDPTAWSYLVDSGNNIVGVAVDINVVSNIYEQMLQIENSLVGLPNSTVPVILTDYVTAYDPSGGCCVLGFHSAEPGISNPAGISAWTWATFIPHNADNGFTNPFGNFGYSTMVLSHEVDELFNDPFVNTLVSPWVDGAVAFAQGNLETGDVIEAMADTDVIYPVTLNTFGGPYNYSLQNVANLEWFTRSPFNGGVYSWPNEHTLSQSPHPVGCTFTTVFCWNYGQGSGGFYFGPPY